MNIYVGNLSWGLKDQDLANLFSPFGEVASAKIVMDKFTQRSKGFGFVEMADEEASKKAIAELDGATVEGRAIKVMEAKPKEDRPAREFNPFRSNNKSGGYNNGNSYNKNRY